MSAAALSRLIARPAANGTLPAHQSTPQTSQLNGLQGQGPVSGHGPYHVLHLKLLMLSYLVLFVPLMVMMLRSDISLATMFGLTVSMLLLSVFIAVFRRSIAVGRPAEVPFLGLEWFIGASDAQRQHLRSARARAAALMRFEGGLMSSPRVGVTSAGNLAARLRLLLTDRDFDGNDYDQLLALDHSNVPNTPVATETDIRRLPTHVLTETDLARSKLSDEGMSCPVCLEAYCLGDQLRTLPCLHRMHTSCIDPWLKQNAVCPMCKFSAVVTS